MIKVQVYVEELYPWFRLQPHEGKAERCTTTVEMSGDDFKFCTEAATRFAKAQEILEGKVTKCQRELGTEFVT
jgi:hypothetical protein